jgi:hypothetical protein
MLYLLIILPLASFEGGAAAESALTPLLTRSNFLVIVVNSS